MKQTLRDAIDERGYETLTKVQEEVSNPDLFGKDMLVSAQTGSGKTLGFGLAVAPTILGDEDRFERATAPLCLVIAPTRELAMQVKRELTWLFAKAGAVMASCVGGMDMRDERRALERGAHIVVATPGRLRDHIMRGSINLGEIKAVVLDEADEMLDLGFREDLEFILGEAPDTRQTLLFSATVPKSIVKLAESYQRDAVRVVAKSTTTQHADITYHAMNVADRDTENAVINTLLYYAAPNAIVFANTRAMVNRLTTRLSNRGFQVVALSGELSQAERTHALQAMRDGRAQVCVATDVAARGIDLPNLDLVVHAELPNNHETMLHRSGRTGRAGRKGDSALIVTKRNSRKAERILSMAKVQAEWGEAPSADAVKEKESERMFADPVWSAVVPDSDMPTLERLTATFSIEQLAAAFLSIRQSVRSAPEELSAANAKPAKREDFGASIWFSVTGGRNGGAEPRRLIPMICKAGNIDATSIGAIRIQNDQSYIQIKQGDAPGFVKSVGPDMTLEPGAVLSQLDKAPDLGPQGGRPGGGKPRYEGKRDFDKPRGDRKPRDFDNKRDDYKAREDSKPRDFDKSKYEGKKSTPPVDWNDAPAPKAKRPKPEDRAKPRYDKPKSDAPKKTHKKREYLDPSVVAPKKPKGVKPESRKDGDFKRGPKPDGKGGDKSFRKPTGGKNLAPAKGKPTSKKNKARAALAKEANQP
ncbi:MAG: DEAD/DEAH box helicase, partial [Planktomarina sp.]